jgi:M6 family metalloprotease-like protein
MGLLRKFQGFSVRSKRRAWWLLAGLSLAAMAAAGPSAGAWAAPAQPGQLTGQLVVLWGDGPPGSNVALPPVFVLIDAKGNSTKIQLSESQVAAAGGLDALRGKQVTVTGEPTSAGALEAQSVQVVGQAAEQGEAGVEATAVSGSQPWISILCLFSDYTSPPRTLSYFQNMYSGSYPGLDNYWRQQSFDLVNVVGSGAKGWYTLPHPRSYYVYGSPASLDFSRAANDCTGVADADVFFPNYVGINLMFSAELDGFAWGGSWYLNRDGANKLYRMTWEPPWGYENVTVIAHEMGHGFGLPHSSGTYGQTYDNRWDVMSDTWTDCNRSRDTTYGCLGQHTISDYKDYLGWIPGGQRYVAAANSVATITMERLALPQTNNYLIARIPIGGSSSHFYTVEARQQAGYDVKLPGQGVIIHEVNTSWTAWAHVLDVDGNGNTGDAGAIWTPGETFTDATNGVHVCVLSATTTGYVVTIGLGASAGCSVPTSFPYNIYVPFVRH